MADKQAQLGGLRLSRLVNDNDLLREEHGVEVEDLDGARAPLWGRFVKRDYPGPLRRVADPDRRRVGTVLYTFDLGEEPIWLPRPRSS